VRRTWAVRISRRSTKVRVARHFLIDTFFSLRSATLSHFFESTSLHQSSVSCLVPMVPLRRLLCCIVLLEEL
jgi:hypothetical protein